MDGGYYAIDSLRIEKGYRAWGHELTPAVSAAPRAAALPCTSLLTPWQCSRWRRDERARKPWQCSRWRRDERARKGWKTQLPRPPRLPP